MMRNPSGNWNAKSVLTTIKNSQPEKLSMRQSLSTALLSPCTMQILKKKKRLLQKKNLLLKILRPRMLLNRKKTRLNTQNFPKKAAHPTMSSLFIICFQSS